MFKNDLSALRRWLTETENPREGLDQVETAVQPLVLHADDAELVPDLVARVRGEPSDSALARLAGFLADLAVRYDYEYPENLVERVVAFRASVTPSRGPPVIGANGPFRRGDLVVREKEGGRLQDAIFIEAEPPTAHARLYGRMVAVLVLSAKPADDLVDRWYLDHLYPGRDYGRPV